MDAEVHRERLEVQLYTAVEAISLTTCCRSTASRIVLWFSLSVEMCTGCRCYNKRGR